MPPLAPSHSWSQDDASVTVVVALRGTKASRVDIFVCTTYVKVSFDRYLLELDLLHPIEDETARAVARDGNLVVTLTKATPDLWPSLTLVPDDHEAKAKAAIRARRAHAVEEHRSKELRLQQEARERRLELERATFRAQMAMEEQERRVIIAAKEEEKRKAEQAIFGGGGGSRHAPKAPAAPAPQVPPPRCSPPKPPRAAPVKSAPAPPRPLPRVRRLGKETVRVSFTPRMFPTPMRESKVAEEEDWLARHQALLPHQPDRKGKGEGGDARDISESDPAWLKARGDQLFRVGDHLGALNAFTASLAAKPADPRPALSNRAACLLRLGRLEECVADCTRALDLAGHQDGDGAAAAAFRLRLLVRRGAAHCEAGAHAKALEDYRAAQRYAPEDEALARDVARLAALVEDGGTGQQQQ